MIKAKERKKIRQKKHETIRRRVSGTTECPRLSVYRSLQNIYAQLIDDEKESTLCSCSTLEKAMKEQLKYGGNKNAAKVVGAEIAKRAQSKGIEKVVFDRGGIKYHGRIKELADAARAAGLKF